MKLLKNRRIIIICIVALTMVFTSATFFLKQAEYKADPAFNSDEAEPDYKYVVKSHLGMVSVFMAGESQPIYVTDAPVDALPIADRQLLEDGIFVYTEVELTSILEDYAS